MPKDALQTLLKRLRGAVQQNRLPFVEQTCVAMLSEAFHLLGQVALERGQPDQAVQCFAQAIRVDGSRAEWHFELAAALQQQGKLGEAAAAYERVIGLEPGHPAAHHNLGTVLRDQGQLEQAAAAFRRAVACNPTQALSHRALGMVLRRLWQFDAALESLEQAHRLQPHDLTTATALAELHEKSGRSHEAWDCVRPFIEAGTTDPLALEIYANLSHRIGREEDARRRVERLLAAGRLSAADRSSLHFALGRLLDRQNEFDAAFEQFRRGNEVIGDQYDPEQNRQLTNELIDVWRQAALSRSTSTDERLVFVVGMPRSGTTLVEQILASHPHVYAAGELLWMHRLAQSLPQQLGDSRAYPRCIPALTSAQANRLAGEYLARFASRAGDARRITDKMTFNFLHLGLISLLFPRARVIHCAREPLDCCLSCYFTELGRYNSYSTNLEHIGHYYLDYRRLMTHWEEALELPMMTVQYEHMAADFETTVRQILEFCGLEWDERCLRFYETKRTVTTASYDQVRRPIYQSSIGRWKNYAAHLAPLRAVLEAGSAVHPAG